MRNPAFEARRLAENTFLIKERDDIYDEHPYIYIKIFADAETIVCIDTGCGGASNDPDVGVTSLREFIETVDVLENEGKPLNDGGRMQYVVVLSHCHYDHILAIEQFDGATILASGYLPEFLDSKNLPAHSLCESLGISTPSYKAMLVPNGHHILSGNESHDTGMIILHTPGHTPDELAVYDHQEKMLYVGDTLYEHAPIIFPSEGSIIDWFSSIDVLMSLVKEEEAKDSAVKVQINAGHQTASRPALEVLLATKSFMQDVIGGKEPVRHHMVKRGEETVVYKQQQGVFSLVCPKRLVREAQALQMLYSE